MRALLVAMAARIADLEAEVAALKERLGLNSRNSSKPPSSDGPAAPPRSSKPSTGGTRGGQKGHPKHKRELLPPDETHEVRPTTCRACRHALAGEDPEPLRHQVIELPQKLRHVAEYRLHRLTCPHCQTTTMGLPPEGAQQGFGPRLQALVSVLTGRFRLSKDMAAELLDEVLEIPMSSGAVVDCEQRVSAALQAPYEQARQTLRAQPVVNVDETPWRQGRRKAWLWVMAALVGSVYQITPRRNDEGAEALLGDFAGILTSDRYAVYVGRDPALWQLCWSHLKRDWKRMAERSGASAEVGTRLLRATKRLFRWWHKVRDGTATRAWLAKKVARLRGEVRRALKDGSVCGHEKTEGTCKDVLGCFESLRTFVAHEGVDPTNNLAERQLRHGVIWRRISFGTDSERGSRFVERVLTVVMTLRQQGRRILDWVAQRLVAWKSGAEGPRLFPQLEAPQAATP